jgi:Kef-type K+ transport system membrane component KefB
MVAVPMAGLVLIFTAATFLLGGPWIAALVGGFCGALSSTLISTLILYRNNDGERS